MKLLTIFSSFFLLPVFSTPITSENDTLTPTQITSGILIVGGIEASPNQFPFQVAIHVRNYYGGWDHHCGGAIYDDIHILTAAHCVYGIHPRNLKVIAGEHELFHDDGSEQNRDLDFYLYHPGFDNRLLDNDIAILTLDWPLDLNDKVRHIHVPLDKTGNRSSTARTLGWGSDGSSFEMQRKLRYVDLNIYSREECIQAYEREAEITEGMLCAGDRNGGKGSCNGDSGGALICTGQDEVIENELEENNGQYLCGLVSWGMDPCALPQYPSVFTDLSYYGEWLYDLLPEQDSV